MGKNLGKRDEAWYKRKLMEQLTKDAPHLFCRRIEVDYTRGLPDIFTVGNGKTLWWEVKLANPQIRSRGIQDLTMLQLARKSQGAWYIIYDIREEPGCVRIVEPKDLVNWNTGLVILPSLSAGVVVEYITTAHA